MKNKLTAVFLLVLVVLLLGGCGAAKPEPQNTPNSQPKIKSDQSVKPEVKTDSGRYVGQIDGNSIEIKVSGVPDELAARAFQLNDQLKAHFQELDLEEGDDIRFNFYERKNQQPLIIDIVKLKPRP